MVGLDTDVYAPPSLDVPKLKECLRELIVGEVHTHSKHARKGDQTENK